MKTDGIAVSMLEVIRTCAKVKVVPNPFEGLSLSPHCLASLSHYCDLIPILFLSSKLVSGNSPEASVITQDN